ncbi:MAG: hypothetical protein V4687_05710 [Bacteroidota bacterium]
MEISNKNINSKFVIGTFFIIAGLVFILRNSGIEIPSWIVSWKTFIIGMGLALGYSRNFKPGGWIVMIIVGTIFLLKSLLPFYFADITNPLLLMSLGIFLILKPWKERNDFYSYNDKKVANFEDVKH